MEDKALAYFASINPLAKKIVHESQLAKNILNDEWEGLDWKKQEAALDDFFVDRSVSEKYSSQTRDNEYAVSFPKLFIQSGEKIIVDMDSDIWSWQDVHSAPFAWRSKSQQDLTLQELDAEKLSKPQPSKAGAKKTQENEERPMATAPAQFVYDSEPSIWETEKYKNWKTELRTISLPETKDIDNGVLGNVRDSRVSDISQMSMSDSQTTEIQEQAPQPPKRLPKKTKSPVPTRLKLSSSFSKHKQDSQEEEQELVIHETNKKDFPKAHKDLESNVFDNPVMNIREQNLMDEETESISSTTSSPSRKPLLREPMSQMMEREEREHTDLFEGAKVKRTIELTDDTAGLLEVTEFDDSVLSGSNRLSEQESERPDSIFSPTGLTFLDNW